MRYFIFLLLLFSTSVNSHHWIAFISCGFNPIPLPNDDWKVLTTTSPNYGRVFINIAAIDFIREYRTIYELPSLTCSMINLRSGVNLIVVGSVDNILKRMKIRK